MKLPRRRLSWFTGGGAALMVTAASILAAPGTAHAHPNASSTRVATPAVTVPPTASTITVEPVVETTPARPRMSSPPYPVTQTVTTLLDRSRGTPARGAVPGTPARSLRTLVLAPANAPGPLPVVVFAPGFDSEPESYLTLLTGWAAAGNLVVAPEAPGSAHDLPGPPVRTDIAGQAQDLSFTITAVLAGIAGPVDASRIAVAGHSDGGSAVATLALNPAFRDPRIASYLVLSGAIPDGIEGPWGTTPTAGRLLVVVGDDDEFGNLAASTAVFETAAMSKTLVVAHGGDHVGTYLGDTELARAVRAETLSFLARYPADGQGAITLDTASLAITASP